MTKDEIKKELNDRLAARTQAFLDNEVKLLARIRELEQELALMKKKFPEDLEKILIYFNKQK